ncbi:PREDICTED: plasminogen receptor (KT) [Chaetura pelagica]|uniref:plasminogen receptor (KT) n=1 Tax=Chaetura pelagica TaxID=8897 RepID=UPI000523ED17|nr:PREDICTED: plasminogen receptor (KT) [Chaetura pelagica]
MPCLLSALQEAATGVLLAGAHVLLEHTCGAGQQQSPMSHSGCGAFWKELRHPPDGLFYSYSLESQWLMQNQMRERQTAMQIAWTRVFLKYFDTFFGLAAVGLTAGAIKNKNPGVLLPIVPLSFVFAYQYDMGYGTLLQRIKGEAENILDTQSTLLELPKGPLTSENLEKI